MPDILIKYFGFVRSKKVEQCLADELFCCSVVFACARIEFKETIVLRNSLVITEGYVVDI